MNTKRPFQVVERMRTAAKFKNMRNARAKHVKLLSSIITKLCKGVTFVIELNPFYLHSKTCDLFSLAILA